MTVTIKHNFTASHGEDLDPSLVAQNAWNDAHAVTVDPGLVGRSPEGGAGPAQTIAVGSGLVLTGGVLTATGGGGGGTGVTNISTAGGIAGGPIVSTGTIVLADVPAASIKGRTAGSVGPPADLTGTQVTTLLDPFTSSAKGLVPASGGGTTNFLRADGAFVPPPGGSGGGGSLTNLDTGVGLTGGPITVAGIISMANVPSMTVKGRVAAGAGAPTDLFSPDITSLISPFTSSTKGAVPASGGGTTNFLRADGAFAAPPGGGGGSLVVGSTPISGGSSGKVLFDNAGVLGETTATGGGAADVSTMLSFGTVGEAMSAIIPGSVNTVQVAGFMAPSDGGGGSYSRALGPIMSFYSDSPYYPRPFYPPVPPKFSSGVPNLVYADTFGNRGAAISSSQPILKGSLAVLVAFNISDSGTGLAVSVPSFVDSVGNSYVRAVTATGGDRNLPQTIYYCANVPNYAPIGTSFTPVGASNVSVDIVVYCVPGTVGTPLALDVAVSQVNAASVNGVSLATGALGTSPELVFGVVYNGGSVAFTATPPPNYTPPVGWTNITIPSTINNPINCIAANSTGSLTFNPTWTGDTIGTPRPTVVLIATFKTFNRTAIDPSYWQLNPTWPVHVAQYGIVPSTTVDYQIPYQRFGQWLASIAPLSDTGDTAGINQDIFFQAFGASYVSGTGVLTLTGVSFYGIAVGDYVKISALTGSGADLASLNDIWQTIAGTSGTTVVVQAVAGKIATPTGGFVTIAKCVITVASPAVVTINDPRYTALGGAPQPHRKRQGQFISFSPGLTTGGAAGSLPAPLVAGQRYSLLYGTVGQTSFQISAESLFGGTSGSGSTVGGTGQHTSFKGAPVNTSGTQSGMHSYMIYGEDWAEVVMDPGLYFAGGNQFFSGYGLKKLRVKGYGAKIQTNTYVGGEYIDVNAGLPGNQPFMSPIASTGYTGIGTPQYKVTLLTPAEASSFYIGSWCLLMCLELQGTNTGPWNEYTFEYVRVRSVNASTGDITFWDPIRYNYRSTFPAYHNRAGAGTGFRNWGPAMLVQLPDTWDQEVEFHGLTLYGVSEEDFIDVKSMRFVDCEVYSWAFDLGPLPSMCQRWVMERCNLHGYIPQIDKLVDYLAFIDCVFDEGSYLLFSSSTTNMGVFDNCLMPSGMSGTPKVLEIRNCRMSGIVLGPAYGGTERMLLENSNITLIQSSKQQGAPFAIRDAATGALKTGLSFSNGTIKVAPGTNGWNIPTAGVDTGNPFTWATPGAKVVIYSQDNVVGGGAVGIGVGSIPSMFLGIMTAFTVLDVYMDGSGNYCVDTDLASLPTATAQFTASIAPGTGGHAGQGAMTVTAISTGGGAACLLQNMVITGGGLPANTVIQTDLGTPNSVANLGIYYINVSTTIASTTFTATTPMYFLAHPCPRVTVRNCTGGKFVSDQAGSPPDIPLLSYFCRAYHGLAMNVTYPQAYIDLIGNLKSWTINVTRPYTGAAATFTATIYMGGWVTSGSNMYFTYIAQVINLKTPGLRTITAAGATGGVAGDTIAAVPFWLVGGHPIIIGPANGGGDTLGSGYHMTMVGQTDQNVTASIVFNNVGTGSGVTLDEFADTVTGATV